MKPMKRAFLIIFLMAFVISAFAGNVKHYIPEVPLIETPQGINDKINYLCTEINDDLSKWSEANILHFIEQSQQTEKAIDRNKDIEKKEKIAMKKELFACAINFYTELRIRKQEQYTYAMQKAKEYYERAKKINETLKQIKERRQKIGIE